MRVTRTPEELKAVFLDTPTLGSSMEWDYSAFDRYPVIRLRDGNLLVLDEDRALRRCLGWYPIYDASQHLSPSEGRRFRKVVSDLCEEHAVAALRRMYPDVPGQRIYDEDELQGAYADTGVRIADAAVDCGPSWLVIEISALIARREAHIGYGAEDYSEMLDQVVDEAEQALSTARSLLANPELLRPVGHVDLGHATPSAVYPIVLLTEDFPVMPTTQSEIRDRLREQHPTADPRVRPVEILSLHDLRVVEVLQDHGGPSLPELLHGKAASAFWADSLTTYLRSTYGSTWPPDAELALEWKQFLGRFVARLTCLAAPSTSTAGTRPDAFTCRGCPRSRARHCFQWRGCPLRITRRL